MNPLRVLLAILRGIVLVLIMVVFLLGYIVFTFFLFLHTEKRAFRLRRLYVTIANAVLGIKTSIEGEITEEGALYVCNHRSFSDPIILSKYLNAFVIAKAEVGDIPVLSQGAKLTGIIYVKRESNNSRKATRELMVQTIKAGKNVLVYPEGTTNAEKKVMEYRPGTFIEAAKNQITLVPIVLEYKNEESLWTGRSLASQFIRQMGCVSTEAKVVVGPALKNEDGIALRDEAEKWTNDTIERIHDGWGSFFDNIK